MSDDWTRVRCDAWLDAISARADGEEAGVDQSLLDTHLSGCGSCRAFAASIAGSRRQMLVQPAAEMPDLSRRVSKLNAIADRASSRGLIRALLVGVAVEIIAVSVPALLLGKGEPDAHDGRHLGAFTVAYGVALMVVAVRPARARAVFPVAVVLAGALAITAVVDLARGVVPLIDEATHIPELISVVLVWLLAVPSPLRAETSHRHSAAPALRVVERPDRADRDAI